MLTQTSHLPTVTWKKIKIIYFIHSNDRKINDSLQNRAFETMIFICQQRKRHAEHTNRERTQNNCSFRHQMMMRGIESVAFRRMVKYFGEIMGMLRNLHGMKPGPITCHLTVPSAFWREKILGLNRDLNPGPPAPEAGIIPLDHWATLILENFFKVPFSQILTFIL